MTIRLFVRLPLSRANLPLLTACLTKNLIIDFSSFSIGICIFLDRNSIKKNMSKVDTFQHFSLEKLQNKSKKLILVKDYYSVRVENKVRLKWPTFAHACSFFKLFIHCKCSFIHFKSNFGKYSRVFFLINIGKIHSIEVRSTNCIDPNVKN